MKRLLHCKVHLVLYQMAETASKSILDAILPQNATKLTKMCSLEFGSLLWHHLTPERKTTIWMHNYGLSCAQPERILENLLPL